MYTRILLEIDSLLNTVLEFSILFREKEALEFLFWSFLQNEITCKFLSFSLFWLQKNISPTLITNVKWFLQFRIQSASGVE